MTTCTEATAVIITCKNTNSSLTDVVIKPRRTACFPRQKCIPVMASSIHLLNIDHKTFIQNIEGQTSSQQTPGRSKMKDHLSPRKKTQPAKNLLPHIIHISIYKPHYVGVRHNVNNTL